MPKLLLLEEWRSVIGYEGLYEVSSKGRVRSLGMWKENGNGGYWLPGKVLSDNVGRSKVRVGTSKTPGYPRVGLSIGGGRSKLMLVHRLVLEAFLGPAPFPEADCRHLDGNAYNNSVDNLRWGSKRENMADKVSHGTHRSGSNHPCAVIDDDIVRRIRSRCSSGEQQKVVARSLGISPQLVNDIIRGRKWTHVT